MCLTNVAEFCYLRSTFGDDHFPGRPVITRIRSVGKNNRGSELEILSLTRL